MSIYLNDVAVTTFSPLVKQAFQEKGFTLQNTVRVQRGNSKTFKFPKFGKSMAKQKAAQDMVVPSNVSMVDVELIVQPWYDAELSDIFGEANVNFDAKRELAEVLAMSIGRRADQLILNANINSGTTNVVAVGSTGFTYAKFQSMMKYFAKKSIKSSTTDIHVAINADAQDDILSDEKFLSRFYTDKRLFDNGSTLDGMNFGGVTWHVFGDMAEGGIPVSGSGVGSAFAWAKQAVGLGISLDFSTMIEYQQLYLSSLVTVQYQANAVAIDKEGIVKIDFLV